MCNIQSSVENHVNGNRSVDQTKLENWLPITAERKAKWWYSTFHIVTTVVGAGVLGLPFAMSQLGWIPGVTAIIGSWLITFYTLWQLVEMHELVTGKRFDRYFELGEHAFGPKLGYWMVMPQQVIVQLASCILYCVIGGKSLKKFIDLICDNQAVTDIRQAYYILLFIVLQAFLSQTPNFNSLKVVSLLAAVMSFSYSMVAFVTSTIHGSHHHPHEYGVRSHTYAGQVLDILNGLGTIAFAFAGHSVVLEIQATIPSSKKKPSKKPMWRGVIAAYLIVIACYITVAVSGYWAFGANVEDDVLISLEHPNWLIAIANFMVFFHVLGSYQVFAMPVFDMIESCLVQKWNFNPSITLRIVCRGVYVACTGFVSIFIPFSGGLLGYFGGLAFAMTSFVICIILGSLIAICAPIGGLRTIFIISAKT